MSHAFPKSRRIHKNEDFRNIIQDGKSIGGEHIRIFFLNAKHSTGRCGITISRRIKGSVQRNRYKRLLRECFRLYAGSLHDSLDVVALLKSPWTDAGLGEIQNEMQRLFAKAGILKKL